VRLSCLARNGPLAQGKKVSPTALRLRRSRRSRSSARSSQGEARCSRALNSILGRRRAEIGCGAQDVGAVRRRERNHGVGKGGIIRRNWPRHHAGNQARGWQVIGTALPECASDRAAARRRQHVIGQRPTRGAISVDEDEGRLIAGVSSAREPSTRSLRLLASKAATENARQQNYLCRNDDGTSRHQLAAARRLISTGGTPGGRPRRDPREPFFDLDVCWCELAIPLKGTGHENIRGAKLIPEKVRSLFESR